MNNLDKKRDPLVSVVIPNYNHAPFLRERIDSVINQTYPNMEIIILDDKSTDNSKEIIESYRANPQISHIVYNEVNSGSTFHQWQKGLSLANGEWIWIAESDDVAHPDFLARLIAGCLSDTNVVLAFSALSLIDSNSDSLHITMQKTYQRKPINDGKDFIKHNMLFGNHILNASSAIFRKDAALRVPDTFTTFRGAGDYLFWIEIARQGKIYKDAQVLDYFRQHNLKVTPGCVADGTQFKETHRIYRYLIDQGIVSKRNSHIVVGFWLNRIQHERTKFKNPEIVDQLTRLWSDETSSPTLSMLFYLINGVVRRIKRNYFGYNI